MGLFLLIANRMKNHQSALTQATIKPLVGILTGSPNDLPTVVKVRDAFEPVAADPPGQLASTS